MARPEARAAPAVAGAAHEALEHAALELGSMPGPSSSTTRVASEGELSTLARTCVPGGVCWTRVLEQVEHHPVQVVAHPGHDGRGRH